jgi:hypothetical protein
MTIWPNVPIPNNTARPSNTDRDDCSVVERTSSLVRLRRTIFLQLKQVAGFPGIGGGPATCASAGW